MGAIWAAMLLAAALAALLTGNGGLLSAAMQGAQRGLAAGFSLGGAMCLWSALAELMRRAGLTARLARLLYPLLHRLFPETSRDEEALGLISANLSANLLGLGNAATPMGIAAVRKMRALRPSGEASDEMCRFVVLNTASVQLLPTTVASLRAAAGAAAPFDILPAVWLTSAGALAVGLGACRLFERTRRG